MSLKKFIKQNPKCNVNYLLKYETKIEDYIKTYKSLTLLWSPCLERQFKNKINAETSYLTIEDIAYKNHIKLSCFKSLHFKSLGGHTIKLSENEDDIKTIETQINTLAQTKYLTEIDNSVLENLKHSRKFSFIQLIKFIPALFSNFSLLFFFK